MTDKAPPPRPSKPRARKSRKGASSAEKRTPAEWMSLLGKHGWGRKCGNGTREKKPIWQHNVAKALCGWKQHLHDANEPFKLTQADYEGALEAAVEPPYKPPKGAISPYCKIKHDGE